MNFRGEMLAAAAAICLSTAACAAQPPPPLKVIFVDVEGGAATLFVTPQGKSLLIDTGWPAGRGGPQPNPSSAERIVAAAKAAGLTKLDYVLITHYHIDHVGGFHDLMARIPIDAFVDHGPNRESLPANPTPADITNDPIPLYARYEAALAGKKRIVLKAGEQLRLDDLTFTAIQSDREIARPLAGAGTPGVGCPIMPEAREEDGGEENARSLGVLAEWGAARVLALGDTTWDVERQLVCPVNIIGKVDVMIADNHGTDTSMPTDFLRSLSPTTVVMNNGSRKGADGPVLQRVATAVGRDAIWQVHAATRSPAEENAPEAQIANLEGAPDAMHPLILSITKAGAVTYTNPRTGASRTYKKAP